jgi:hypothetical protein
MKKLDQSKFILSTHESFSSNKRVTNLKSIKSGDVVEFEYDNEIRTVYVVNPLWMADLHGLTLSAIDRRDLMVEVVARNNPRLTDVVLYEKVLTRDVIKKLNCYRTYKVSKIQNLMLVDYEIDERGRQ